MPIAPVILHPSAMRENVFVTALFDIQRGNSSTSPRTQEDYLGFFSFWASIQNRLIIYCGNSMAKRIMEIRRNYGTDELTAITVIDDITKLDPERYSRMLAVEADEDYRRFRIRHQAMENEASYSYLMLLKFWFLKDAKQRVDCAEANLIWIDFGYNHGGKHYTNSADFQFRMAHNFPNRVTIHALLDPSAFHPIDVLQFMIACISGSMIICPAHLAETLYELICEEADALLAMGAIDDDQQLLLMAYKKRPSLFNVQRVTGWFTEFELYSGKSFSIRQPAATKTIRKPSLSQWLCKIATRHNQRKKASHSLKAFLQDERIRYERAIKKQQ